MPTLSRASTWNSTALSDVPAPILQPRNPQVQVPLSQTALATWTAKINAMDPKLRRKFLEAKSFGDVVSYAQGVEGRITENVKSSTSVAVAQKIQPLVVFMETTASLGPLLDPVCPAASIVLGGIYSILSATQKHAELQEFLVELLTEKMGKKLSIINDHASILPHSPELQETVVDIYFSYVDACMRADTLYIDPNGKVRNGLSRFVKGQISGMSESFTDIEMKFSDHVQRFNMIASRGLTQSIQGIQVGVHDTQARLEDLQDTFQDFKTGGNQVREMVERTLDKVDSLKRESRKYARMQMLDWITEKTSKPDFRPIVAKLEGIIEGTGQWLFDHKDFKSWIQEPNKGLLWVHGNYGCGKSHLAYRVIQQLNRRCNMDPRASLAYVFCGILNQDFPSLETTVNTSHAYISLLGSVLHDLYSRLPEKQDLEILVRLRNEQKQIDADTIETAIRDLISKLSMTFIVIDGLDELERISEEHARRLCRFISSLTPMRSDSNRSGNTGIHPNILIFSRRKQDLNTMKACPSIEINEKANEKDVTTFVEEKVTELGLEEEYREEISKELLARAGGIFLWVSQALKEIKLKRRQRDRLDVIKRLPPSLFGLYAIPLQRIIGRQDDDALRALFWVANAARLLTENELLEALSIQPEMSKIEDRDRVSCADFFSGGCEDLLVANENGQIQFFHASFKEFLKELPNTKPDKLQKYFCLQAKAHEILAHDCLNYLKLDVFKEGPSPEDSRTLQQLCTSYPLLQYASHYWGDHFRDAGDISTGPDSLVHSFLTNDSCRNLTIQVLRADEVEDFTGIPQPFPYYGSCPLHLICWFELNQLLGFFTQVSSNLYQKDVLGFLPIDYAAVREKQKIFNLLLDTVLEPGSERDTEPKTFDGRVMLVHQAATYGWSSSIQKLISMDYEIDKKDNLSNDLPLHCAARTGKLDALEVLINAKADINARNKRGETPLITASVYRQSKAVELLLKYKADVLIQRDDGATALHCVSEYDNGMVKKLLERGAEFKPMEHNRTPLHSAVFNGETEIFKTLLAHLKQDSKYDLSEELHRKTLADTTLFHIAATSGYESLVSLLKDCALDPGAQDRDGETVVHLAARGGHIKFVEELIKEYPNLDLAVKDNNDRVPLHIAVLSGSIEMVKLLLPNGIDTKDRWGRLPFHLGAQEGNLECLRLLLDATKESVVDKADSEGYTALHYAAMGGSLGAVQYLIEECYADATIFNNSYLRPLHLAILKKHKDVALFLLPLVTETNMDKGALGGTTALHVAAQVGDESIIRDLIQMGYNIRFRDHMGSTALHFAVSNEQTKIVKLFLDQQPDMRDIADYSGQTCAHVAASTGNIAIWELVCPEGRRDQRDDDGRDALFVAAITGQDHMVSPLLKAGLPANGQDKSGSTPLMLAVNSGFHEVVQSLLDQKVDLNQTDVYGRTALHLAAISQFPFITGILAQAGANAFLRDKLGLSALDYARTNVSTIEVLGDSSQATDRQDAISQANILATFIHDSARRLSKDDIGTPSPLSSSERLELLLNMAVALSRLNDREALRLCMAEVYMSPMSSTMCKMCQVECTARIMRCLDCPNVEICRRCYEVYIGETDQSQGPKTRRLLGRVQLCTQLVTRALWPVNHFDAPRLAQVLNSCPVFSKWVKARAENYREIHALWTAESDVNLDNCPGRRLLLIMEKVLKATEHEKHQCDSKVTASSRASLTSEINSISDEQDPRRELSPFTCCGHDYLETGPLSELDPDEKNHFTPEDKLSNAYWHELAEKYSQAGSDSLLARTGEGETGHSSAQAGDTSKEGSKKEMVETQDKSNNSPIVSSEDSSSNELTNDPPRGRIDTDVEFTRRFLEALGRIRKDPEYAVHLHQSAATDDSGVDLGDVAWKLLTAIKAEQDAIID